MMSNASALSISTNLGCPIKVGTIKRAKGQTIEKKLWDVSEELTNVRFNLN